MKNRKVAILTTFRSADFAYSLNRVVQDQIKMLIAGAYIPKVLVCEGFIAKEAYALPEVELIVLPDVPMSNEGNLPENYQMHIDNLSIKMQEALKDVKVVITHDIISQPASLIHNLASRVVANNLPDLRWLHWIHSVFSSNIPSNIMEASEIGRKKFPNSFLVYPNSYDIPRVARNFGYEETEVKWCPHPTDIESFFDIHPDVSEFIRYYGLLQKDILIVYPCRLDRGKQPHFLVELAAAIKRNGQSVSAIIMDFHSTGGDKVTYREEMKHRAGELGLNEDELIFFSEFNPKYAYESPPKIVKDLMSISNIFLMPSRSETYSLVTQEAALTGNFLIINHDFLPFRSIFGDLPKYYQFGSNIGFDGNDGAINTEYSSIENYFMDIARYIKYMTTYDKVLAMKTWIRRDRNLYAILENYFDPLINAN